MKTTIIAKRITHSVQVPPAMLTSVECASVLVNTTSFIPGFNPSVDELVFYVKNLTAPNSIFLEAAITNSLRDFGLLDTDVKVAVTKLSGLGFSSAQSYEALTKITEYVDQLFPVEGI